MIKWKFEEKKGTYSVNFMYKWLTGDYLGLLFYIYLHCSAEITMKIKISMSLLEQNALLTRDVMMKRWNGNSSCIFCTQKESVINHLFFRCPVGKVWGFVAIAIGAN